MTTSIDLLLAAMDRCTGPADGLGAAQIGFRTELDDGGHLHHQLVSEDGVVRWHPMDAAEAAAWTRPWVVHLSAADAVDAILRRSSPNEATAATWIEHRGRRDRMLPGSAMDDRRFADAPLVPGASVVVQRWLTGSPFGTISQWDRFEDGRLVEARYGVAEVSDVRVRFGYDRFLDRCAGDMTAPEAVYGSLVQGEWSDLMVVAGLVDGPELTPIWTDHRWQIPLLRDMASVFGNVGWDDLVIGARNDGT